ncbi:hypothetical protein BB560_000454 [Smittium megazygosporum]|uniref:U2A'/phosphoprotein 32 family A C-terminal domain-containing protein n=1 Tax=Smittium megazygosporum TaxID=133381 RepID=A0A2T9ZKH8_9FUNG|nr:hypothetical protein BB560_000454 [Smittium megazygosporum]
MSFPLLSDMPAQHLVLSSLKSLNLSSTGVAWLQVESLCMYEIPNLRELYLGYNEMKLISTNKSRLQKAFSSLETLDLQENDIKYHKEFLLFGFLPRLLSLNISGNPIEDFPNSPELFTDNSEWRHLQKLEINDSKISEWSVVTKLNNLPALRSLGIRRSRLVSKSPFISC